MARKKLTPEQDAELQEPLINAVATYFDNVYEEGSTHASVRALANLEEGCLMFVAFKVPEQCRGLMGAFLTKQHSDLERWLVDHVEMKS